MFLFLDGNPINKFKLFLVLIVHIFDSVGYQSTKTQP